MDAGYVAACGAGTKPITPAVGPAVAAVNTSAGIVTPYVVVLTCPYVSVPIQNGSHRL